MPRLSRADVRILYGRNQVPRSHRRVMLALLSGAPRLSGCPGLSRLAQVWPATAYAVLDRLENRGLVESRWAEGAAPRPRFYTLTPRGRETVMRLLELETEANTEAGAGPG